MGRTKQNEQKFAENRNPNREEMAPISGARTWGHRARQGCWCKCPAQDTVRPAGQECHPLPEQPLVAQRPRAPRAERPPFSRCPCTLNSKCHSLPGTPSLPLPRSVSSDRRDSRRRLLQPPAPHLPFTTTVSVTGPPNTDTVATAKSPRLRHSDFFTRRCSAAQKDSAVVSRTPQSRQSNGRPTSSPHSGLSQSIRDPCKPP